MPDTVRQSRAFIELLRLINRNGDKQRRCESGARPTARARRVDAGGQGVFATAHEYRPEEKMALVDQTLGDRQAGELRPADRDVRSASSASAA